MGVTFIPTVLPKGVVAGNDPVLATMLETALSASRPGAFRGYERALLSYQEELVAAELGRGS